MKFIFAFCLLTLSATYSNAQEKELADFKTTLNLYIDLRLGKVDSLKLNEANQVKYSKKTDDAFKTFVQHKSSYEYDKYVVARNDASIKFSYLDGRIYIHLKTFPVNNKTFVVYSYSSQDKKNYIVKEIETNSIVYEGNSNCCYVDHIYAIDSTHFMIVEENGDMNSSRTAFVLSAKKRPWAKMKAFEGLAFGQVPAGYFTKKFVKKREQFQLDCDMEYTLSVPADVNNILFDPRTKTLSYKQYSDKRKFKLITAKWENETFKINDYSVQEGLSGSNIAVPN